MCCFSYACWRHRLLVTIILLRSAVVRNTAVFVSIAPGHHALLGRLNWLIKSGWSSPVVPPDHWRWLTLLNTSFHQCSPSGWPRFRPPLLRLLCPAQWSLIQLELDNSYMLYTDLSLSNTRNAATGSCRPCCFRLTTAARLNGWFSTFWVIKVLRQPRLNFGAVTPSSSSRLPVFTAWKPAAVNVFCTVFWLCLRAVTWLCWPHCWSLSKLLLPFEQQLVT